MSRRVRALISVASILAFAAPQHALAAPPLPSLTLTMTGVTSPGFLGQSATYSATLSPAPPSGTVVFEISLDGGQTYTDTAAVDFDVTDGLASASSTLSGSEGTRIIRAHYTGGGASFADGFSTNTLSQTVQKSTPSLFNFEAFDSDHVSTINPATSPVKLYVEKSGASPNEVHFEEHVGDTWVELGVVGFQTDFVNPPYAILAVSGFAEGSHDLRARLPATSTTNEATTTLTLVVAKGAPTIDVTGVDTITANKPFVLNATLSGGGRGAVPTGTVNLYEGATVIASGGAPNLFDVPISGRGVGTYTFHATYTGDFNNEPATSAPFVVTVTNDIVEATGIGIQYATFYPVRDGYRDTVAFKGVRSEPISVTARVYNSTGTRVKTLTATSGTGSYALVWTGRNSSGTLLPAGKYKVVQTLKDAMGTTATFTGYVTLSKKVLVTYTKSITKSGYDYDAKGKGGTGTFSASSTYGWVKLRGGSSGYAVAGWELRIPAATIYKSLSFKVYAKSPFAFPMSAMAVQNFVTCPRSTTAAWTEGCFTRWTDLGNGANSLMWYSAPASVTTNSSSRYVRIVAESNYATLYVYKARVTVTYQVLE